MTSATIFQVNSPEVVQETIDGEVVIVNLKKGDYYSLLNTGTEIWLQIEQGISSDQIINFLCQKYSSSKEEIAIGVNNLIEKLLAEEIIIPQSSQDNLPSNTDNQQEIIDDDKPAFEAPQLSKYTDMEELLALDPIHEVDEMGWPNAKIEAEV